MKTKLLGFILIGLIMFTIQGFGQDLETNINILHSFEGRPHDGAEPFGILLQDGSVFYGMARFGGNNNFGIIFKMEIDGSGYQVLHHFTGNEGAHPHGSLIRENNVLYGDTITGGDFRPF